MVYLLTACVRCVRSVCCATSTLTVYSRLAIYSLTLLAMPFTHSVAGLTRWLCSLRPHNSLAQCLCSVCSLSVGVPRGYLKALLHQVEAVLQVPYNPCITLMVPGCWVIVPVWLRLGCVE